MKGHFLNRVSTIAGNFLQNPITLRGGGGCGELILIAYCYYINNIDCNYYTVFSKVLSLLKNVLETLSHFKSTYKLDKNRRSGGINPVVISPVVISPGVKVAMYLYNIFSMRTNAALYLTLRDDIFSGNFCKKKSKRYGKLGS